MTSSNTLDQAVLLHDNDLRDAIQVALCAGDFGNGTALVIRRSQAEADASKPYRKLRGLRVAEKDELLVVRTGTGYVVIGALAPRGIAEEEGAAGGMLKTSGGGYFLIPTGPSSGVTVSSPASSNSYGSWTELSASAPADLFIVGVRIVPGVINLGSAYVTLDIGTGAGGSETSVGEVPFAARTTSAGLSAATVMLPFPIPVTSGERIAARAADLNATAIAHQVALHVIAQADLLPI